MRSRAATSAWLPDERVIYEHGGPTPGRMEFSRTYGEHATFIVDGQEVTAYGEDADDYQDVNFFGH